MSEPKQVTPAEAYAIFTTPAVVVDKFFAAQSPTLTRISFAESVMGTDEKIPRNSIALTDQSLAELAQLINAMLKARAKQSEVSAQPEKPAREELN